MDQNSLSILITGDYCPINRIEKLCQSGNLDEIYNDFMPVLQSADYRITNLECPLTNTNNPILKNGPTLKANPEVIKGIKHGGFNMVTLANNHLRDYGDQGVIDTLKVCSEAGIETVGAGINSTEAAKERIVNIKGKRVGFINICENEFSIASDTTAGANPIDPIELNYQFSDLKKNCDTIIVIVHGGKEMFEYPLPHIVKTFRYLANLGASAVVGHHPHCISGYEIYNNVPLIYSLGNFIFDEPGLPDIFYEGIAVELKVDSTNAVSFDIIPYYQNKDKAGLKLFAKKDEFNKQEQIKAISETIADDDKLASVYSDYISRNSTKNVIRLLGTGRIKRKLFSTLKLDKIFIDKRKTLKLLNNIACETHQAISIKSIKKYLNLD